MSAAWGRCNTSLCIESHRPARVRKQWSIQHEPFVTAGQSSFCGSVILMEISWGVESGWAFAMPGSRTIISMIIISYLSSYPSSLNESLLTNMWGVTYRTLPNFGLENFSYAAVPASILIFHSVFGRGQRKGHAWSCTTPPTPSLLLTPCLAQSSLPCLLYSSWPLHNRTQIEIVLRREGSAFLSHAPTHAHRLTASPRIRPAPPPVGRASCVYTLVLGLFVRRVWTSAEVVPGPWRTIPLARPHLKKTKQKKTQGLFGDSSAAPAGAGQPRTSDSFCMCNCCGKVSFRSKTWSDL